MQFADAESVIFPRPTMKPSVVTVFSSPIPILRVFVVSTLIRPRSPPVTLRVTFTLVAFASPMFFTGHGDSPGACGEIPRDERGIGRATPLGDVDYPQGAVVAPSSHGVMASTL